MIFWALILFFISQAFGVDPLPAEGNKQSKVYILDVPPLMKAPEGTGIVGDVVLEAFKRTGIHPQLIVVPIPRALSMPKKVDDVFVAPLARISERENEYTWVVPIVTVKRAFFTLSKKINTFESAMKNLKIIAVSRDTASHRLLIEKGFPKDRMLLVSSDAVEARLLKVGRVDAFFDAIPEGLKALIDWPPSAFRVGHPLAVTQQFLACSKKCNPQTVAALKKTISQMRRDGTIKRIQMRYPEFTSQSFAF
jgi:polar amino acid transport system substrate-binding protein